MEAYLREIARTPLLTRAEERQLAERIAGDDPDDALAARNHLVAANLRLVVGIARKFAGRGVDLEDLISEGNLGLFHAAERYDLSFGARFTTYATWWVEQCVRRATQEDGHTIRVPCYMLEVLARWLRAGQPDDDVDLLACMPASWRREVRSKEGRAARARKLTEKIADARKAIFGGGFPDDMTGCPEYPPDPRQADPCDCAGGREDGRTLAAGLARLEREDSRAALVLRLRFGLGGEQMTLADIGVRLGLTRERVRQLEGMALVRLRAIMGVEVSGDRLSYYERTLGKKAAAARERRAKKKTSVG